MKNVYEGLRLLRNEGMNCSLHSTHVDGIENWSCAVFAASPDSVILAHVMYDKSMHRAISHAIANLRREHWLKEK